MCKSLMNSILWTSIVNFTHISQEVWIGQYNILVLYWYLPVSPCTHLASESVKGSDHLGFDSVLPG